MSLQRYIIDTSVIAKLFFLQPDRELAIKVFTDAASEKIEIMVPEIVLNELNQLFINQELKIEKIIENFNNLEELIHAGILEIVPNTKELLIEIARIANQNIKHSTFLNTFLALSVLKNGIYLTACQPSSFDNITNDFTMLLNEYK